MSDYLNPSNPEDRGRRRCLRRTHQSASLKKAWTNEEAFAALRDLAGDQFDRDCVEALLMHQAEVEQVQRRFQETTTV
jgi:HD-GYP domain-containing protein (c-di-GMP phosphodiesterase class II)